MAPIFFAPEIIERIIYFLTHGHPPGSRPGYWERLPDAGQYACVSRFWQHEIERETFASLRLDLPRLLQLNSIVSPQRRRFVRRLNLHVQLRPGPRDDPEADDEKLRNNQVLQATLEAFLLSLGQWTTAEVHRGGIELIYYAYLPHEERPSSPGRWSRAAAWEQKYRESVLELTDPGRIAQLPPAIVITKLKRFYTSRQRNTSVLAISTFLAKLPAVKCVELDWWKLLHFARMRNGNILTSWPWHCLNSHVLICSITDLADSLPQIKNSIDKFTLHDTIYRNGEDQYPLTSETLWEEEDKLSKSIRILSQRVKEVKINHIAINDEVFYPRALYASVEQPRWDRLVKFIIFYLPIDPSGELLFRQDPSEQEHSDGDALVDFWAPSDVTEPFKYTLNIPTPAIQKLYLSAARAALQIPVH